MPNTPLSPYARGVLMMTPLFFFLHFSNVARWNGPGRTDFSSAFGKSVFRVSAADFRAGSEPVHLEARPFEANRGQHGERARFFSRAGSYDLLLAPDEAILVLGRATSSGDRGTIVRSRYVGACKEVRLIGLDERRERVHYFVGSDPAGWRADIPTFGRVLYEGLYPGIDLLYGSNGAGLEYGFIIGPGADPDAIELEFDGAQEVIVDAAGELRITDPSGRRIRLLRPSLHQERDGLRREIAGGYELRGSGRIGFHVAPYDDARPLVIGR